MPDPLDMWLRISYPGPVGNNIQAITKQKKNKWNLSCTPMNFSLFDICAIYIVQYSTMQYSNIYVTIQ